MNLGLLLTALVLFAAGPLCDSKVLLRDEGNTREVQVLPPESFTTARQTASLKGYYHWTWSSGTALSGATISVAFSGWTDPDSAIRDSKIVYDSLLGSKYICFGGGNANGRMSAEGLKSIDAAITDGKLSGYSGVVYDVEEGDDGLEEEFEKSFALAKENGLSVMVTVSHSAPYGISDRTALMDSFLSSTDIDYISPQLYTTGMEDANDYETTGGYGWENYAISKPTVVVSIVKAAYYEDAVSYFADLGITLNGFVQWMQ